jgi:transcriptional regulator with XRE-family HTH domain
MSDISQIDGLSVRRKRESLGWAVSDLATMACLSTKQIKQIEEGGMAAFYSESVKLTAARKVAGLLDMTEAQLFGQVVPTVIEQAAPHDAYEEATESSVVFRGDLAHAAPPTTETAAITRSESWHVLAQPPENLDHAAQTSENEDAPAQAALKEPEAADSASTQEVQEPLPPAAQEAAPESSNANYLIKILALFLVALAAAALLRQQAGDEKAQSLANEPPSAAMPANEPPASAASPAPEPTGNAAQASSAPTTEAPATPVAPAPDKSTSTQPSATTASEPPATSESK